MSTVVERHATVNASPEQVWAYLADLSTWPRWNPDLLLLEKERGGLVDGGSIVVRVTGGLTAVIAFRDIEPDCRFVWHVVALGGLFTLRGEFVLEPTGEGHTDLVYRFGPTSLLLRLAHWIDPKSTVEGTETGLANIVAHFDGD